MIPIGATWIRFPRYIGDAVMLMPILRLLRQMGIGPLVVWGPELTVSLLEGHELADCVIPEQKKPSILELTKIFKQYKPLRVITFPKTLRPPIAAWLAGVKERIGVSDGGAKYFNTHHTNFWHSEGHFIARYCASLATLWGDLPPIPFADYRPIIQIEKPQRKYICLMPGSNWRRKEWLPEHFRALAMKAKQSGLDVVVLGSSSEIELGRAVLGTDDNNLCGKTDMQTVAAWLCGSVAAIGNDSGLSHLAAACGTKTIAIFGPTDPSASSPWGSNVITLQPPGLDCSPCKKNSSCPRQRGTCIAEITPDQVWEYVM